MARWREAYSDPFSAESTPRPRRHWRRDAGVLLMPQGALVRPLFSTKAVALKAKRTEEFSLPSGASTP